MDAVVFVYTTWPDAALAEAAGRELVADKLAACVNIVPGMVSVYAWQGAIERAEEAVMIVKTRASLADAVAAAVRAVHPYDTPAIVTLPIAGGDPAYLAWILAETAG
ncbi:MAG TPA: divalent-cation tolerance protein CutA [Hyphomicrobiales bacterium]|nr:divalent-cation tolerance protein CutA [Hyphomicrobiales bacterium]